MMKKICLFFKYFSLRIPTPNDGDILLDYSKNRINEQLWSLLLNLAKSRNVEKARDAMFSGNYCIYWALKSFSNFDFTKKVLLDLIVISWQFFCVKK